MIAFVLSILFISFVVAPTIPAEEKIQRSQTVSTKVRVLKPISHSKKHRSESVNRYRSSIKKKAMNDREIQKLHSRKICENVLKMNPQDTISELILQKYPINIVKPNPDICYTMPCQPYNGRGTILERKAIPDNSIWTNPESIKKRSSVSIKKAKDKKVKELPKFKLFKPPVTPSPK